MNLTPTAGTSLRYDEFWRWLREHLDCILEAGTSSSAIYDFEDLHWEQAEEEDGRTVLQAVRGKNVAGEILVNPADVVSVDASPDLESGDQGHWLFEAMGGPKEEPTVVAYFVMAHGIEEPARHKVLKH